ncbi:hypothetical protein DPMN_147262 [Dreissena polymorpha]|uniref:Uncharacterized protein n=1 Tax=Dreissena polymorpha TaxID=45954 RepID=A0A9D4J2U6_DREPO|nr:hypothetical protein DPMN_147262 [Dreissena polymorpha]
MTCMYMTLFGGVTQRRANGGVTRRRAKFPTLEVFPIIMKLGQKICPNDILHDFENGFVCFKNMATKGGAFFLIWL